jgi:hypothetical protein
VRVKKSAVRHSQSGISSQPPPLPGLSIVLVLEWEGRRWASRAILLSRLGSCRVTRGGFPSPRVHTERLGAVRPGTQGLTSLSVVLGGVFGAILLSRLDLCRPTSQGEGENAAKQIQSGQ